MIPNSTVLMTIIVAHASFHIGQANTHPDEFSTWMFCFNNVKEYFVIRKHICSTKNSLFLVKDVAMTNVYLSQKIYFRPEIRKICDISARIMS